MAEWFLGPVMEKVIDLSYDYFKDEIKWQTGMPEELQRLQAIHPKIQAAVSNYSQLQIEDGPLNKWYWQLRDAVDEANDVLDEIEYRELEKEVSKDTEKKETGLSEIGNFALQIGKGALEISKRADLKRLEEAVQKLDKISAEVTNFHYLLDSKRQEQRKEQLDLLEARETGSMPTDNILGRSEEMKSLSEWLSNIDQTENTNTEGFYKNISLLSVVGHGGMGKTTLLQHVYNDGAVTEEFGVKAWVCVSQGFEAKTVIKNILESITEERPSLETVAALQKILESKVKSRRFLIVLDDIWEDAEEKWKNVLAPLSHGSSGSKILITTRMNSVASMFAKIIKRSKEPLQLKGLEEDQCLELLDKHAFAGEKNPEVHKILKSITEKMVKKLLGSPLAAKVIGGILNFNLDASYWRRVLNTDIRNVNPGQNMLLPILKLSYIYLPNYLQNCFSFCGIFPQDHEFDKADLVRMWIALGFVQSSNNPSETLEDTGGRYFDILVRKSFFYEFELPSRVYYKMHDLMHELAQFVSAQEIFRIIDDKELSIPPTIRHLSIQTNNLEATFKKIGEFKNLRSIFLSFSKEVKCNENFMDVLSEIFKASKNIRLLVVCAPFIEKIPDTMRSLIHLRYLKVKLRDWNIDCQDFSKLPRSVSHLYHLQYLIYKPISDFMLDDDFLQRDMNNLYNLRYLGLCQCRPSSLSAISSIKNLNLNNVPHLKSLSDLTSSLEELVFENLESMQCLPSLSTLSSLRQLKLNNIPHLKLLPYLPSTLKALLLEELESVQCLPSSLSTLSSLKSLTLNNIPHLRSLPDLPSSLENLELERLESLQFLPSYLSTISSLWHLRLKNIPHLESMPDLPSSLSFLSLQELENLNSLPELPARTFLSIEDCHPQLRERYKNHPKLRRSIEVQWKFPGVWSISITR